MVVESNKSAKQQIIEIFSVLSLGVAGALVLAMATLYYYGPTGSYKAGNVLISPEISAQLSYVDTQSKNDVRYVFDKVEYLFFNQESQEWRRIPVEQQAYEKFYELIADERSLTIVPEQLISLFNSSKSSILTIMVKTEGENNATQETRSFQEVQILPYEDYYRILIHDQSEGKNWAYFFHENIYEESKKILAN